MKMSHDSKEAFEWTTSGCNQLKIELSDKLFQGKAVIKSNSKGNMVYCVI